MKTSQNRPGTVLSLYTRPVAAQQAKPAKTQAQLLTPKPVPSTSGALVYYVQEKRVGTHASTSPRPSLDTRKGSLRNVVSNGDQSSRPSGDIRFRKPRPKIFETVVDYEYSGSLEEHKMRLLATTFSRIGDGVDPFLVLPRFKSPRLNSVFLLRNCEYAYSL